MINIGIYMGYWSTNIGNSFFQIGADYVLRKVFPNANIFPIADEPGYILPGKGNPTNSYNPVHDQNLDYAVILGPFVRPETKSIILPTLKLLKSRGTKIIAMGVGMMDYTKSTIEESTRILKEVDPEIFITRDHETYEAFAKYTRNPYDGIDLGFFSSDIYTGTGINGNFVTFNFDQLPEPVITEATDIDQYNFVFNEINYGLNFNLKKKKLYEKGLKYQLLDRLFFKQKYNEELNGYKIIRTDHRYNPVILKKIYSLPNTFSSDIPHPYWAIYKNSALTISNRVHACVATLSFGNPAWLFTKSPRAYLLDRVGAKNIKSTPVTIDMGLLQREKENLIDFVKKTLDL